MANNSEHASLEAVTLMDDVCSLISMGEMLRAELLLRLCRRMIDLDYSNPGILFTS